MLTSYLVRCPHSGCRWFGSLLPRIDSESWRGYIPNKTVVTFECPQCLQTWRARVKGDDVEPLPQEEFAALPQV